LLAGPPDATRLADSLVEVADAVIGADAQLDVVGFSFGGIVAGLTAHRLGRRVQHLVLVSAGGLGINARVPGGPRRGPRGELIRFMFANPHTADETALRIHLDGQARTRFRSGSIPSSTLLVDVVGQLAADVHVVCSDRDAFGDDPNVRFDRVLGSRPDANCHTITDAGHWSPYEAPDQIDTILTQVLTPPPQQAGNTSSPSV
jgi:pimeloyl-ACP methyl ester carboxylesterase